MKRSGFIVALYIGRNIELYYRVPGGTEEPVRVLTAEFRKDDTEGSAICDLLVYDGFSPEKMERFCKGRYKNIHETFLSILIVIVDKKSYFCAVQRI